MINDTLGADVVRRVWSYTYDEYDQLSGTDYSDSAVSGAVQVMSSGDIEVQQGLLDDGDAFGFFGPSTTINGSDWIQFPSGTGPWYVVNNIHTEYFGGTAIFQEAKLERVKGE